MQAAEEQRKMAIHFPEAPRTKLRTSKLKISPDEGAGGGGLLDALRFLFALNILPNSGARQDILGLAASFNERSRQGGAKGDFALLAARERVLDDERLLAACKGSDAKARKRLISKIGFPLARRHGYSRNAAFNKFHAPLCGTSAELTFVPFCNHCGSKRQRVLADYQRFLALRSTIGPTVPLMRAVL